MKEELVVLIDEQNNEIGVAQKDTVHTKIHHFIVHFRFLFLIQKRIIDYQTRRNQKNICWCVDEYTLDTLRQMKQLSMRQKEIN